VPATSQDPPVSSSNSTVLFPRAGARSTGFDGEAVPMGIRLATLAAGVDGVLLLLGE
jgi:hypothetical protein